MSSQANKSYNPERAPMLVSVRPGGTGPSGSNTTGVWQAQAPMTAQGANECMECFTGIRGDDSKCLFNAKLISGLAEMLILTGGLVLTTIGIANHNYSELIPGAVMLGCGGLPLCYNFFKFVFCTKPRTMLF